MAAYKDSPSTSPLWKMIANTFHLPFGSSHIISVK